MAACKVSDQLYHRSSLPSGFEDLLNDVVRSVITSQPLDLTDHITEYLEALVDRRTLWDMQLESGKQRSIKKIQKSKVIKSETDKTETNDKQPCCAAPPFSASPPFSGVPPCPAAPRCSAIPKRLKNATRNLQSTPSPKPQNDTDEDGASTDAKPKRRPVTASRKPISNGNSLAKEKDTWTDEVVLGSHLAQHEALRQVIKEIGDMNEQIIALEETAGNTTQGTAKTRNTTQARDLAEKHSSLKRALDKMMLICTWVESNNNKLRDGGAPEIRENPVEKTTRCERQVDNVNQNLQGTLGNQFDTLKDTMEHIQAALASMRRGETTNRLAKNNVATNKQATEQILETRGHNEHTNILDDIAKLNQWLQYMLEMRSEAQPRQVTANPDSTSTDVNSQNNLSKSMQRSKKRQQQTVTTLLETQTASSQHKTVTTLLENQTASSQNIIMMTNTTQAKKVSPKKQKKLALETDASSSSMQSSTASSAPGKQTKASTGKHLQLMPASLTSAPEKETHIKLEYHVNETAKRKDTRVLLVSTTGGESTTAREATQINFKSVEGKSPSVSSMKQDGATDTSNGEGVEKAKWKAKSVMPPRSADPRRGSVPVPLRKLAKPAPTHLASSESDMTKMRLAGTDTPKSQTTNDESNVANVDSYSAVPDTIHSDFAKVNLPLSHESMTTPSYVNVFCTQSISSVSQNSWAPNQTTTMKSTEKIQTSICYIQTNDETKACVQLPNSSAQPTGKLKATQGSTDPQKVDNISPQLSAFNAVASGSSLLPIHAPTKKTSTTSNQPTNEQVLSNEVLSASFIKSPSYATAQPSVENGDTSTPKKENAETLPQNASASSFPKSSSHSTARSSPQKTDTKKPATETTPPNSVSSVGFPKSSSHSTTTKSSPQKGNIPATKPTAETVSDGLTPNPYSSVSFLKSSSHISTGSSPPKVNSVKPTTEATPDHQTPYIYSVASFVKASSHSTANFDPTKGDAPSKDVKPGGQSTAKEEPKKGDAGSSSTKVTVITPQATGSNSLVKVASNSAAKLSTQKGDVSTSNKDIVLNNEVGSASASFAKSSGQALASAKGEASPPAKDAASASFTKSSDRPNPTSSSHNVKATTIAKADNTEKLQPDGVSAPSFRKNPSSHSVTKSGTQKAIITSGVTPLNDTQTTNDQTQSPRYVEYTNIFPQIPQMQITPDPSNIVLSKNHPSSASTRSFSKPSQTHQESGISSVPAPSIERVKMQKDPSSPQKTETGQRTEMIRVDNPLENAFSKRSSSEAPSKDSAKLDNASIHSTTMSTGSTKFNKASIHSTTASTEGTKPAETPSKDNTKLDKASVHSTTMSTGGTKLSKASIHSTSTGGTKRLEIPSKESTKLDKASIHSTSTSMGTTKQAEAPSKEKLDNASIHSTTMSTGGTKLDKASVHSTSKSITNSNKHLPTETQNSESTTANKDSGKQVQDGQTKVSELHLTAESNNNNTQQDKGLQPKIPKAVSTVHQNASLVSLHSFKMPEQPIKEANESQTSVQNT